MRSLLTVTSATSTIGLTKLATLKTALGISGSTQDTNLERLIIAASQTIITYLGRQIARETVAETFRPDQGERREALILSRYPVVSITSAVEDGETVPADEYEVVKENGLLYRLTDADGRSCWPGCGKIVVTYVAGYLLPADANPTLPADIEQATIVLIQGFLSQTQRDPMLRSEKVDGVGEFEYWVGSTGGIIGALPPELMARLDAYRSVGFA